MVDLPYLYKICYKTGLNGETVEGHTDDIYKIGHYFAAPYLYHDLRFCFVATLNNIPEGYVVGTGDTVKYTGWLNSEWLPKVRKYYDFDKMKPLNEYDTFFNDVICKDTIIDEKLKNYPSHLHIDLLPSLQGKGVGRKLMERFFNGCRNQNVKKVHLVVSKENTQACVFYKKIGMHEVYNDKFSIAMGLDLTKR